MNASAVFPPSRQIQILNDAQSDEAVQTLATAAPSQILPIPALNTPQQASATETDDEGEPILPGDILSFRRNMYSHDAIYVGNGEVIHLWTAEESKNKENGGEDATSNNPNMEPVSVWAQLKAWAAVLMGRRRGNARARVTRSSIEEVRQNCRMRVRRVRPVLRISREEVVQRAESALGKSCNYHVIFRNCQHFTTWAQGHISASQDLSNYISLACALTVAARGIFVGHKNLGVKGSFIGVTVGLFVGALSGALGMFTFDLAKDARGDDGHLAWLTDD